MIKKTKNLSRERKEQREQRKKKKQEKLDKIRDLFIKNKESGRENTNIREWILDENNNPVKMR